MRTSTSSRQQIDPADVAAALAHLSERASSIVGAYVFGSVARGKATSLSDIDVALLLTPSSAAADVCGRVADELSRQFGTDGVDVVSLDNVPVPLAYRVIREGRLVVCRDAARIERFVADTVLHYLDFQPLRDRAFRLLRSKILDTADGR
jgi:hypothetical protein